MTLWPVKTCHFYVYDNFGKSGNYSFTVVLINDKEVGINPLECKGNYSATSNNMKLVHCEGGTVGLGGVAARPGPSSLYQI